MAMVIYQGPIPNNTLGKSENTMKDSEKGRFVGLVREACVILNNFLMFLVLCVLCSQIREQHGKVFCS